MSVEEWSITMVITLKVISDVISEWMRVCKSNSCVYLLRVLEFGSRVLSNGV